MTLLYRVFDVRITLFDLQEHEIPHFHIKGMSGYCRERRKDSRFNAECIKCDTAHLVLAKAQKDAHIYRCHEGLLEGIVPLYNTNGTYLGAIVFGQLRERGKPVPVSISVRLQKLYRALPEFTKGQLRDMGDLLKYLSEYIIENELIKYQNQPWAEKIDSYINSHLAERITLGKLGEIINRSATFISHHFEGEFGRPPQRYVLKKKMEAAMAMLKQGESVGTAAGNLAFYDEFHFSKSFKAYWGKPPKHFKQA
jgi:AraC-like DNA-binding protein/ligand-binding sensor protein